MHFNSDLAMSFGLVLASIVIIHLALTIAAATVWRDKGWKKKIQIACGGVYLLAVTGFLLAMIWTGIQPEEKESPAEKARSAPGTLIETDVGSGIKTTQKTQVSVEDQQKESLKDFQKFRQEITPQPTADNSQPSPKGTKK